MPTGATIISDIIIPEIWVPYIIEKTAELSSLIRSGIVVRDPVLDALATRGGKLINMPFFQDISGADEVLADDTSLTPGKIGTAQDIAALLQRGRAFGSNDLAGALAGADPLEAISSLIAEYWNRREQATLLAILVGVFLDNVNDSSDLINDIAIEDGVNATEDNLIGSDAVINTRLLLGDAMNKLTAIMLHSVCYGRLQKLNLIDFTPTNVQNIGFGTYLGHTLIVDDGCPATAGGTSGYKYTSYFFGQGAIGRGEGMPKVPVETDRDSLLGEDYLIHRRHFILHPRGIQFASGNVAGTTPTNTELALAANWDRVYEKKNIRIAKLVTNG
jgi:hypothetical protein